MPANATAEAAANRFGLGARPGDLAAMTDPKGWLRSQLDPRAVQSPLLEGQPTSAQYQQAYYDVLAMRRQARMNAPPALPDAAGGLPAKAAKTPEVAARQKQQRQTLIADLVARQRTAVLASNAFAERLVRFWSNHFAISLDKRRAGLFAPSMEREAIRPHVFGRFGDMVLAVETHPGMLAYLDNARSIGTDSRAAQRARMRTNGNRPGLNENLAREIMELHTLGVAGGYTQQDVIELAKAITGWSLRTPREMEMQSTPFVFRPGAHEPGVRTVLGRRYVEDGESQGRAILSTLAVHPATARHVSTQLARHFVADQPPPALVDAMQRAWLASDGDLATVYRTLIDHPASWDASAVKFKTPDDFLLSAMRACALDAPAHAALSLKLLATLGQPVFEPRSPAGFGDVAADWGGPDALLKRVQSAEALAERVSLADPNRAAADALGRTLDAETATAVRRAESPRQGLALMIASPAFQWRR